jgi:hypothetical protein
MICGNMYGIRYPHQNSQWLVRSPKKLIAISFLEARLNKFGAKVKFAVNLEGKNQILPLATKFWPEAQPVRSAGTLCKADVGVGILIRGKWKN